MNTVYTIQMIYGAALVQLRSVDEAAAVWGLYWRRHTRSAWRYLCYFFSSLFWCSHGTGSFSSVCDPVSLSCQNCSTSGKTIPSLRLTVSASLPPPLCSGWGWASLLGPWLELDRSLLSPCSWPEGSGLGQGDWRAVGWWGPGFGFGGGCLRRVRRLHSPL